MRRIAMAGAVLLAVVSGCGGDDDGGGGGGGGGVQSGTKACSFPADAVCAAWTGPGVNLNASWDQICSASNGGESVPGDACPATSRVGRCTQTQTQGPTTFTTVIHFYPPNDPVDTKTACLMVAGASWQDN
jgi:hypothetical protein